MSDLTIRPLEIDDFPGFLTVQGVALQLAPEVFGSDYDWFEGLSVLSKEQRFERYMNFPYQYLLGAVDSSSTIVGMIGYSGHEQPKLRHKGRLWGLFVLENYRGHGLATKLVESVLETARDILSIEQIQLTVSTKNEATYGLYLRLGFSVFGTELRAMKIEGIHVDEYQMVKFLL